MRSTSHKVPPRPTKPYDYWCTLASSSLKPEKTKDKRMYKTTFEILQSCDLELVCQHKVSLGLVRPQLRRPRDWSLTPVIMEICIPKPVGKNLLGTALVASSHCYTSQKHRLLVQSTSCNFWKQLTSMLRHNFYFEGMNITRHWWEFAEKSVFSMQTAGDYGNLPATETIVWRFLVQQSDLQEPLANQLGNTSS